MIKNDSQRKERRLYALSLGCYGLSVTYNNVRTAVNWCDARLFAVNDELVWKSGYAL
jgi:hypothetical protein